MKMIIIMNNNLRPEMERSVGDVEMKEDGFGRVRGLAKGLQVPGVGPGDSG
jgi:tetrahydromethanopterin S-methyltransferase subunit F